MTLGKKYLNSDEIRSLARRSDMHGLLLVCHCWLVIISALAVFSYWPSILTFFLAITVIGSRQLGLAILMHEAAHNALFKSPKLNNWAGEWLCGCPILADLNGYRTYHLKHHRHTQTNKDPDLKLSKPFPSTRRSLLRKLMRDITGQTGIKQRLQQIMFAFKLAGDVDSAPTSQELAQAFSGGTLKTAFLVNLIIFVLMSASGSWWWWLIFWRLPLLTWFQLVLRMRNIAEHGAVEFSDDPFKNVRTTKAGPVARLFFAPYWVNYHLEHHLIMYIPCRNLPKLHNIMLQKGLGNKMEIGRNYWSVLLQASSKPA